MSLFVAATSFISGQSNVYIQSDGKKDFVLDNELGDGYDYATQNHLGELLF